MAPVCTIVGLGVTRIASEAQHKPPFLGTGFLLVMGLVAAVYTLPLRGHPVSLPVGSRMTWMLHGWGKDKKIARLKRHEGTPQCPLFFQVPEPWRWIKP